MSYEAEAGRQPGNQREVYKPNEEWEGKGGRISGLQGNSGGLVLNRVLSK